MPLDKYIYKNNNIQIKGSFTKPLFWFSIETTTNYTILNILPSNINISFFKITNSKIIPHFKFVKKLISRAAD